MIGTIYINGVIGQDTTLLDVIRQVKAAKNSTEYLVKIDSVGGYVDAGKAIYDYLKGLEKPVTTYTTKAFSIASVIFMAGGNRIIPQGCSNALMIHLPWAEVKGTSDTLAAHAVYLKKVENDLVGFYSQALQIDENAIQALLTKETYLDATQALEMGFATEIQPQMKAVAMINNDEKEDESLMLRITKQTLKTLSDAVNLMLGIKAELVLQDATGAELTFPDLEPTDVAEVGEKATVDGKPAEGDFVMPDGSTIRISAGVVKEILPAEPQEDAPTNEELPQAAEGDAPKEDDQPAEDDKLAALEQRVADLEKKIAELIGNTPAENTEVESKMLEVVAMAAEKVAELQGKYEALAKQVGSDYQPQNKKENAPSIKASEEEKPKFSIKRK